MEINLLSFWTVVFFFFFIEFREEEGEKKTERERTSNLLFH